MSVWLSLKFIIHNIFFFLVDNYIEHPILFVKMSERIVYVIQEIPGTKSGNPKINIMGAAEYGSLKFLLPELSQIIFSPGPLIFKLRKTLKNFTSEDYLLLTGDPAIIGVACSIVSDITNGK